MLSTPERRRLWPWSARSQRPVEPALPQPRTLATGLVARGTRVRSPEDLVSSCLLSRVLFPDVVWPVGVTGNIPGEVNLASGLAACRRCNGCDANPKTFGFVRPCWVGRVEDRHLEMLDACRKSAHRVEVWNSLGVIRETRPAACHSLPTTDTGPDACNPRRVQEARHFCPSARRRQRFGSSSRSIIS